MASSSPSRFSFSLYKPTVLLRSSPSISLLTLERESSHRGRSLSSAPSLNAFRSSNVSASSALQLFGRNVYGGRFVIKAVNETNNRAVLDVVFEPFEEVKKELLLLPTFPQQSLGRHKYSDECENAINDQINVEYNVSYVYHAMYAYFDRDNVALKGLAKFFKDSSEEERQHAEKLMEYQNKRGGKVRLQSMLMPLSEYDHIEKGDALYALELALSLEKLTNEKLLNLHKVADQCNDVQLTDFVESEFLVEQVEAIKKMSEYVSQLRRVGKGHGVWDFDQKLLAGLVAA